ncbi:MAG: 30S ribosomal protein S18 [Elusimicrobia bacterium]|nr:30S ribosomal protein S18 [Elusimicrobiota bacterium]
MGERSSSARRPDDRPGRPRRWGPPKRKACRFCVDRVQSIDYKNVPVLKSFVTDRGKILSGRLTGTCAGHQRMLTRAIKRARTIALIPFTGT